MIQAVGFNKKPKLTDCACCMYNHTLFNDGRKIVCTTPLIKCENFKEVRPANRQRMIFMNPEWTKWHKEKEDETRARAAKGEYLW